MKVGDLIWCSFGDPMVICTLLKKKDYMFWDILWNGSIIIMHEDHMEVINGTR